MKITTHRRTGTLCAHGVLQALFRLTNWGGQRAVVRGARFAGVARVMSRSWPTSFDNQATAGLLHL